MFPRRVPYAFRLPDLVDVHSLFLFPVPHRRITLERVPYDCGTIRQRRTVPVSGHKIAYAPHRRGYSGFDHPRCRFPAGGIVFSYWLKNLHADDNTRPVC